MPAKAGRKGAAKISRNKKKYWRSGTGVDAANITLHDDAQLSHLDDVPDDALFTLDRSAVPANLSKEASTSKTTRKSARKDPTDLACFRNLAANSLINAVKKPKVVSQRRQQKRDQLGITARLAAKELGKIEEFRKQTYPAKSRAVARQVKVERNDLEDLELPAYDLWTDTVPRDVVVHDPAAVSIPEHAHVHYLRQTKRLGPKRPNTAKPPATLIPKVKVAHAGASYNPDYDEYQNLLSREHVIELNKLNAETDLTKQLAHSANETRVTALDRYRETMEGFLGDEEASETPKTNDEETEAMETSATELPIKQPTKPKNKAQRRREKKEKDAHAQRQKLKVKRTAENVATASKSITRKLRAEAKISAERTEKRAQRKLNRQLTGKLRLGKTRFEPVEEPVLLTEDLVGSLRELKPEGNLLNERWKSLQERAIIAPSQVYRRREENRHRVKRTEKRSYKELNDPDRKPR